MTKERRLYVKVMYIYDSTSQKSGNEMLQAKVVVKNVFNVHFFFFFFYFVCGTIW
jgi:hypothetical protein